MIRIFFSSILIIFFLPNISAQIENEYFSISREAGFFKEPFQLRINKTEDNARVVYTTDYTDPNVSSTPFPEKLSINKTTILKFKVYIKEDSSQVITYSYYNTEDIWANQSFQDVSAFGLDRALRALPILSISGSLIDPVDPERKEVPVAAEFIWNDQEHENIIINAGLQIWGDSPSNPKKNFRLEFKKKYGAKKLKKEVFHQELTNKSRDYTSAVKSFDKLLLRAGSQDGLNAEFSNELTPQYIRNRVMFDLSLQAGLLAPHGRFVHLFLNGKYWGHYHLMERPDEVFFEDYLDVDKDNVEIFKAGDVWYKGHEQDTLWHIVDRLNDQPISALKLSETNIIDLQLAARYLIFMGYASGHDWGKTKNIIGYSDDGKQSTGYKFMLYDVDYSLGNGGKWHPEMTSDYNFFNAPFNSSGPVPKSLLEDNDFRQMLLDELYCLCIQKDGFLTPDNVKKAYLYRADQVERSLLGEEARWGKNAYQSYGWHVAVDSWEVAEEWQIEKKRVLSTNIPKRTKALIEHFEENGFSSPLKRVKSKVDTKKKVLKLKNPNKNSTIYYTTDGSDPRMIGGNLSSNAIMYTGDISLTQGENVIFYRVRSVVNGETLWSSSCPTYITIK